MQLFYSSNIQNDLITLNPEEARHCVQVLRKRVGDQLDIVDGQGGFYKGEIIEANKKNCLIKIISSQPSKQERPQLKIAIAPTKNIDRLEWFLEKATEIGIDEVIPILCERSERKRIRLDRLEKIVCSGMKQSLKAWLPTVRDLTKYQDLISEPVATQQKFIAYCNNDELPHLKDCLTDNESALILIGPEGDFSEAEINIAKALGFKGVSLGSSRLRTETAGLVATTIYNLSTES